MDAGRAEKILVTGRRGRNDRALLQAGRRDELPRQRIEVSKSAALGAALQAAHGGSPPRTKNPRWEEKLVAGSPGRAGSEILPDKKAAKIYDKLLEKIRPLRKRRVGMPSFNPRRELTARSPPGARLGRDGGRRGLHPIPLAVSLISPGVLWWIAQAPAASR